MGWYRRSKVAFDVFHKFTAKIPTPKPVGNPVQRTLQHFHTSPSPSTVLHSKLHPRYSAFQRGIYQESPFLGGARRYYYVDKHQVTHFRRRGYQRWLNNPKLIWSVVLVGTGFVVTVYFGNLETVPYTNRTHFVLLSNNLEKRLGETQFEQLKTEFKGSILPAIHPDSVRVRLIAKDVINALQRGLSKDKVWTDIGYSSDSPKSHKSNEDAGLMRLGEDSAGMSHYSKADEVLDDKWVHKSRKEGITKKKKLATEHVEAFKWEVLVVDRPIVNAFCLPGGKIVVFTGLLNKFRSDNEIATILGHEVAHALARHVAEGITKNLWFFIVQMILYQFVMPDLANAMSTFFLRLPFSRKMEIEADYIGLLMMASAGYDPRVAPGVYKKLDEISGDSSQLKDYLSTHPSGKKRSKLLAQSKVMEEALLLYREAIAGRGIEGFL